MPASMSLPKAYAIVVGVDAQGLQALCRVASQQLLDDRADPHHLVRLQDQVGNRSSPLCHRLMEDDPGVRQR